MSLKSIESQLLDLINIDKKNWTNFYLLLKEIEDQELYKPSYKSFTAWVKDFCIKTKTHESIVWNRKKAGKVYDSYSKIKAEQGIDVKPITESNVSVDSLVLLDKINKYDEKTASQLVDKVINKEITKKDLREVYQSIRPSVDKISTNPHLKQVQQENQELTDVSITANDIVSTVFNLEWLGVKPKASRFKSAFESNKSRVFTEFPLYTGTSKKSRRVDMLISENITSQYNYDLNVHGIEIKVSKSDLLNDTKYTEYAPFVDFLWLAIPNDLVEVAQSNTFKDCGIVAIDSDRKATIIKKAKQLAGDMKHETLKNIVLKIM